MDHSAIESDIGSETVCFAEPQQPAGDKAASCSDLYPQGSGRGSASASLAMGTSGDGEPPLVDPVHDGGISTVPQSPTPMLSLTQMQDDDVDDLEPSFQSLSFSVSLRSTFPFSYNATPSPFQQGVIGPQNSVFIKNGDTYQRVYYDQELGIHKAIIEYDPPGTLYYIDLKNTKQQPADQLSKMPIESGSLSLGYGLPGCYARYQDIARFQTYRAVTSEQSEQEYRVIHEKPIHEGGIHRRARCHVL